MYSSASIAHAVSLCVQFSLDRCKKLMSERSLPTNLEICRCAGLGDVIGLMALLRQGTSPGSQDEHGNTPLFHAIWSGTRECVSALLARMPPAMVNMQNKDGMTALHFAVAKRDVEAMRALIEAGADPRIRNHEDDSAQDFVRSSPQLSRSSVALRLVALGSEPGMGGGMGAGGGAGRGEEQGKPRHSRLASISLRYLDFQSLMQDEFFTDVAAVFDALVGPPPNNGGGKKGREGGSERKGKAAGAVSVSAAASAAAAAAMASPFAVSAPVSPPRVLRAEHIRPLFRAMGLELTDAQLEDVLAEIDVNGDGVTVDDIWKLLLSQPSERSADAKHAVDLPFAALDVGRDGSISVDDLVKAQAALGPALFAADRFEAATILRALTGDYDSNAHELRASKAQLAKTLSTAPQHAATGGAG